ncbi:hypothetical protein ABZ816_32805 [Actinosynnema sp. NPDC047251]|uniref:hypothetical protein n=1 Tax=Saccharothrix espanaensis TaxID=103731 RepID=UPI00059DDA63|nr:hypothetical protein [Saccharothrix espanaensis]
MLALGIPFGVAANALYQYLRGVISRRMDPISLAGQWGELISGIDERRCSIGEIRYDLRRRMWVFDGTN